MMDLLHKRYASPFSLLDEMMATGTLCEYVDFVIEEDDKETEWSFYLHKEFSDISFDSFRKALRDEIKGQEASQKQLETAVTDSFGLLNDFIPL